MASNKKICFVVAVDITLKFLLISELKFFKNKGYEVFVVCSHSSWLPNLIKEGIAYKEIVIHRKAFTPFSDLVSLIYLFFYLKKERFDVVLTFTPKPGLLGQLAAKMAGVPVIINTIFGYYFHENTPPLQRNFFMIIEKIAARCSSFIFFRNVEDFQTAKKEGIIKNTPAEYIGDGINLQKYNRARFSEEFIKEKKSRLLGNRGSSYEFTDVNSSGKSVGLSAKVPVIGIVARLVKEKGYEELFTAFKKVAQKFPEAVLLVVGPTDLQKKDNINPVNINPKNIIFLGERNDADELYAAMDMFVLPSYREGFPHSVMEASAMSLPVVTTNVRGCRNAIEPGITGILVPAKNSEELSKAILQLLSDPEMAKKMGEMGRKKAEKDFDKNSILQKMEATIKDLIQEKLS